MTAPSFSSFPPVFDSFPELEQGSSSRPRSTENSEAPKHGKDKDKKHRADKEKGRKEEEARGQRRDKRDKRKDRSHDLDEKAGRSGRHERERSSNHRRRRSTSYDDERKRDENYTAAPENRNRLFYLDRKGDNLNTVYGSLHAGDVPKYWHVGRGKKVLGLESNLAVLYRGSKGVEIGEAGWHSRAPQLTDSRARAMLASKGTRRFTASSTTLLKYEEVDGFIRVHSRKGKEKEKEYRSIYIARDERPDSDASSQSGSESSDDSNTPPMSAREESIRNLEQRVAKDPTSESDWLLLIQHSLNGIAPSSKNAEKARAEISVSILERALSAHPSNVRSLLLRLKYLRIGEIIWDVVKMRQEWEKGLKDVGSTDIYVEWLDWVMRATPSFNSVVEDAIRATHLVPSVIDDNADCAKLRIFWRITTFFRQAGYVERGFALFQAQAELTFNVSEEDRKRPFEERLDALEEFWESDAPRVGEAGAAGWKTWKIKKEGNSGRRTHRINTREISDPYSAWHYEETESDRRLIFPARMSSNEEDNDAVEGEDVDEDPYSTVLFSDIRPFLIDLQTAKGRDLLRFVWLAYLGLHIPGLSSALSSKSSSSDDRWADTSFLQPSSLQSLFPRGNNRPMITVDSSAGVIVGREKTYAKSFDVVKSWSLGALDPLEGLTVDGEYRMWSRACLFGSDSENSFGNIRRLFREFSQDGLHWSVMALAFEAAISPSESALEISQALLAENSSSEELLASHAYLERIRRKYEKARKVYRIGVQSLAQSGEPSMACLWWGWAELEWLLSKSDAALEIVLRAAGQPDERTSVNVLRAKRRLEEFCQPHNVAEWRFRFKWIRLRILLELLVGTLETTIDASERFLASEETGTMRHEALTVASLLMVYHHMVTLRNHAPPTILRGLVEGALDVYPSNSIVIGLFLECEKGEGVWGRVRALMRENAPGTLQDKSVARRLIEVWIANWEEGRWLGEVERVRAGLEAAVTSDRTKGSSILWKVYVKFEITAGNAKRAKAVLFRSLKACPMVKELYLLAFGDDLRHAYSRRELMDLSDTMAERGIRLRRSLAEIMEVHGAESDGGRSDSDQSINGYEDEQEYESRELKRLMPY